MEKKEAPGIKNLETTDNIGKTIKKADHIFLSVQEATDKYRGIILGNEKFVVGLSFAIGMFISWVFSECTGSIVFTTLLKSLIAVIVVLAILLTISSKKIPLVYATILGASIISGILFGDISLAWDSTTYMVVTNDVCTPPLVMRDFLNILLGAFLGGIYIGKRFNHW